MKQVVCACVLFVLVCTAAWPGVVIEMQVKDSGSAGEPATDTIYAQGEMLRMDPHPTKGSGNTSMLFRDETLWIVNHDKKQCQKIDKEGVEQLSAELGGAMKEMEAEMAKLPPEQRAMMEKMMKGKMPGGMGTEAPPRRIEEGATEKVGDYSCTIRTLYAGEQKVWEVCAADESVSDAAAEAMEAFQAMSRFTEQLLEAFQQGPFAEMFDTPFHDMNEVGGFPVRVRSFGNGQMTSETTLESVTRQDLEDAVFAVPERYKVKNLADQVKKKGR